VGAISPPLVRWLQDGETFEALWRLESAVPPPERVIVADGNLTADEAYGLACQGFAILWRGDFQQARQMLNALASRADRAINKSRRTATGSLVVSADAFHAHRQARSQRARTLAALLIPLNDDYTMPLRRAPDIREACV
jgi:hypothetical protein